MKQRGGSSMDDRFGEYMQQRLGRVLDQLAALQRANEMLRAENRRLRAQLSRLDDPQAKVA
jgi:cell division protein FtsB